MKKTTIVISKNKGREEHKYEAHWQAKNGQTKYIYSSNDAYDLLDVLLSDLEEEMEESE